MESAGHVRQHGGMSKETTCELSHPMQDETPRTETTTANPARGRSSVAKLPAELREAVDRAIAEGATIDEIAAGIRDAGENCSRSAVGRYAKDTRALIQKRREADRVVEAWMQEFGERPQGEMSLALIESLREMALATMEHLASGDKPVSTKDIARLCVVLKRIEDADNVRVKREQAMAKAKPKRPVTPVPVDPWNPKESHSIPDNPGESRPENGTRGSHTEPAASGPSRRSRERLH